MAGRILRDPLFAFLALGVTLFLAYSWLAPPRDGPIVLSRDTRAALIAEFETLAGRKASAADVRRIEREYVTDELLFREALDAGVHLKDGTVRRRLIEEMRQRATGVLPDPSVEDLLDYYSDNLERYHSEPAASFEQVYFAAAPSADDAVLDRLRRDLPVAGDSFQYGRVFSRYGRSMLRGMFGESLVAVLWDAPARQWIGPIETTHGWHFIRVTELHSAALRPFPEVSNQVENDWIAAQIQSAVDRKVDDLARGQTITIER